MIQLFLQGLVLGLAAAVTPGPFQAFLLNQTMKGGIRRALLSTLAPLISDGPIVVVVLFLLYQTPSWFLNIIRVLGGFFLLYLANEAYQSFRNPINPDVSSDSYQDRGVLKAALVNALGPGPYLFWGLIAGPILLAGWRVSPGHAISFLVGFYGTLISGFVLFVLIFAAAKRLGRRVTRILSVVSTLALLFFGGYQLWQGLQNLMSS